MNPWNPKETQTFPFSPLPSCRFLRCSCVWEGAGQQVGGSAGKARSQARSLMYLSTVGPVGFPRSPYVLRGALSSSPPLREHAFPGSCLNEHDCSDGPFLIVSGLVAHDGDPEEPGTASLTPGRCCWACPCSHEGWDCPWVCVYVASQDKMSPESHIYPHMVYSGWSLFVPCCHQWLSGLFTLILLTC